MSMNSDDSSVSASPPTKLLYQIDETLREHVTRVTSVQRYDSLPQEQQILFKTAAATHENPSDCHVIETKETIFYVQGGGQPCDTGTMTSFDKGDVGGFIVEAVRYGPDGRILHFGTYENQNVERFKEGELIRQQVSGTRRDLNSRNHTAGHLIGLAVRRLTEKENALVDVTEFKASHYQDACFVEFKGIIDGKFKDAIQSQALEYVKASLPVKLFWYKPEELSTNDVIAPEGMPLVTGTDGTIRVVDVVGAGAYPCGGTHVQQTGLVGDVTVKGIKRQKGVSKVSYAIGN